MTKEDVVNVKPVSGIFLFGYEEGARNQSKCHQLMFVSI